MILVDANLLVYAANLGATENRSARAWLEKQLSGPARVGLPWASLLAFVRITTNPRVLEPPLALARSWAQVEEWLEVDVAWIPQETPRHAEVLRGLLHQPNIRSDMVGDAHLAALAIEHGLTLCSVDADFSRFRGLRWENPLAAGE